MPTADLGGHTKPFGLGSSPDGSTLYVTFGSGAVVAVDIATKVVTTIASGYATRVKHGVGVDAAGNVYYSTGANGSYGDAELLVWDGSSVSTKYGTGTGRNWWDLHVSDDGRLWYIDYPNWGVRLSSFDLTTNTQQTYSQPPDDEFEQSRSITSSASYVAVGSASRDRIEVWNRSAMTNGNDATGFARDILVSFPVVGLAAVSDTECYALTKSGYLRRYDLSTGTGSAPWGVILPEQDSYGDIHITSTGRCFVTRGAYRPADNTAGNPTDVESGGTDTGIYEIVTSSGADPVVGHIGFGL